MERPQKFRCGARRVAGSTTRLAAGALTLLVGSLVLVVSISQASDAPHWLGAVEATDCTSNCHTGHHALGGGLNPQSGNTNLCVSCHSLNSLPIDSNHVAIPGVTGTSHAFDVNPENVSLGALVPENQAMFLRLMEGNVVCSTCHNQHSAEAINGGTPRISDASLLTAEGSLETALTSGGTFSGPVGVWYLVEITQTGSSSSALYRYSKDNGTSWFPSGCSSATLATCLVATSTPSEIESGVELTFTGGNNTIKLNDRWEFYASYPFLRIPLDSGANTLDRFCRDCHRGWVMTHNDVETWNGNKKSHPVGVGLNANALDYDRAQPLDGNGLAQADQSGGAPGDVDGNPTNDLKLDATGNVQCLSCHGVHYADSNTLTVDGP